MSQETVILPSLDMPRLESKQPLLLPLEDGDEEVLACGVSVAGTTMDASNLMRAPLPMPQVLEMELQSGCNQGTYFVELMRRRLQGLLSVQERWISRMCNQKHAKHVATQVRIRDFVRAALASYDSQFGAAGVGAMECAPVRRRKRTHAK